MNRHSQEVSRLPHNALLPANGFKIVMLIAATVCLAAAQGASAANAVLGCMSQGPWKAGLDEYRAASPEAPIETTCVFGERYHPEGFAVRPSVGQGNVNSAQAVEYRTLGAVDPIPFTSKNLLDLSPVLTNEPQLSAFVQRLPDPLRTAVTANGALLAIPYDMNVDTFVVRRDVFAAAGLPIPTDWSWSSFLADAKKATQLMRQDSTYVNAREHSPERLPGQLGKVYGAYLPSSNYPPFWRSWFFGRAGSGTSEPRPYTIEELDRRALDVADELRRSDAVGLAWWEATFAAAGFNVPLLHAGLTAITVISSNQMLASAKGFSAADLAVLKDGAWSVVSQLDLAAVPPPSLDGVRLAMPMQLDAWAIAPDAHKSSIHPLAQFFGWFTTEGRHYYEQTGELPADRSLGLQVFGPEAQGYYETASRAVLTNLADGQKPSGVWNVIAQALPKFWDGRMSTGDFRNAVAGGL